MSIEVRIPALLQRAVGGAKLIQGQGRTVKELLDNLDSQYPGFKERMLTGDGKLHPFIRVYLNDEDISFLGELEAPLKDGDVLSILPAMAGG
jgi:MoaD family protein